MPLPVLALPTLALAQPDFGFVRDAMTSLSGPVNSVELFVEPEGKVLNCKVLTPALSERQNAEVCEHLIGKDSGAGAKGPDGSPAYGVVVISKTAHVDFGRSGLPASRVAPDLEIYVSQMPGKDKRKRVGLIVYIDERGKVQRCLQEPGEDLEFSKAACQQSAANVFPIKNGQAGDPVGYVTGIAVDFVRDETGG